MQDGTLHTHKCEHCLRLFEHAKADGTHKCVLCGAPTCKFLYDKLWDGVDGQVFPDFSMGI